MLELIFTPPKKLGFTKLKLPEGISLLDLLGVGGFSQVYRVKNARDEENVLKVFQMNQTDKALNEQTILTVLQSSMQGLQPSCHGTRAFL